MCSPNKPSSDAWASPSVPERYVYFALPVVFPNVEREWYCDELLCVVDWMLKKRDGWRAIVAACCAG